MEWLESLILGVVQGITEFLPVSSDGHLVITQQAFAWLTGQSQSGEENLFFDIMLHVGNAGGDPPLLSQAIWTGPGASCRDASDVPPGFDRASVFRVGLLAVVATLAAGPVRALLQEAARGDVSEQPGRRARLPDHGGRLAAGELGAQGPGRRQGPGRDDLARRPADRPRPDVRPLARREPERPDDRRGAWRWASRRPGRSASAC